MGLYTGNTKYLKSGSSYLRTGSGVVDDQAILDLNPVIWLDASDASTFTLRTVGDTNYVEEWRDKSGNGNHAAQNMISAQPRLTENQEMVFDGVNDVLKIPKLSNYVNGFTIVARGRTTSLTFPNTYYTPNFLNQWKTGADIFNSFSMGINSSINPASGPANSVSASVQLSDDSIHTLAINIDDPTSTFNAATRFQPGELKIFTNELSSIKSLPSLDVKAQDYPWQVGTASFRSGRSAIRRIVFFNYALSDAQIESLLI